MAVADTINSIKTHLGEAYASLEEKGATIPDNKNIENLADSILSVPSGGGRIEVEKKDINFYDYDGFRVYSYTKEEFLQMTDMPANPEHEGLISQGWNWTFEDAYDYALNYGIGLIGQLYTTDDGSTRIYVNLDDVNFLTPYIGVRTDGTITVNWGDGTIETYKGSGTSTTMNNVKHTYQQTGKYVISIKNTSDLIIPGVQQGGSFLLNDGLFTTYYRNAYQFKIYKIEFGDNIKLNSYSLSCLSHLETITNSKTTLLNSGSSYIWQYSGKIRCIILGEQSASSYLGRQLKEDCPFDYYILAGNQYTSAEQSNMFTLSLKEICIPPKFSYFSSNSITYVSIPIIKIPKNITSLSSAFNFARATGVFDFTKHETIPSVATNGFPTTDTTKEYKIVVPDALYDDWIVATNWTIFASNIVKESDYNA